MKPRALIALVALLCAAVLAFSGCGYPEQKSPPVFAYDSPLIVQESARLHAREVNGYVSGPNVCCGSMLPVIQPGDFVIVAPTPFSDALLGKIAVYAPKWNKSNLVAHRFVSGDAQNGFIASGDNNPRSEPWEPVTALIYRGEVVAIYRLKL